MNLNVCVMVSNQPGLLQYQAGQLRSTWFPHSNHNVWVEIVKASLLESLPKVMYCIVQEEQVVIMCRTICLCLRETVVRRVSFPGCRRHLLPVKTWIVEYCSIVLCDYYRLVGDVLPLAKGKILESAQAFRRKSLQKMSSPCMSLNHCPKHVSFFGNPLW